jgi:DNA-binding Lrp family transcriptional regulator
MDVKDLELLTLLNSQGRADPVYISSKIGITPDNVERRIKLLLRSGVIKGFSAFFDRRMFGYDTTFVKLHYRMRDLDRLIDTVSRMPQVAQVYPNMDEFMLVEIVHWDRDMLMSAIRAMERAAKPMTVSAHFVPMLPDEIPEVPEKEDLELLINLVKDGRVDIEMLADLNGMKEDEVTTRISKMVENGVFEVRPVIQEDLIQPYPTFSTIVMLKKGTSIDACFSSVKRIARENWSCKPLERPEGVWVKSFGKDLHNMDMMIERYRREDYVDDVLVVIPDTMVTKRSVDIAILKGAL